MEEQKPADEGDIKTPVKKLAKELMQKYVQKMVKEATKKALEKQHENIDNKKFKRLQDKLGRSSEQEKIDYFTESVDKVSSEIPDIKDKDLIEHISREFGKNATKHTSRLLLTLPSVTKIVVIVIALIAVYILGGVPNGDTGTQLEASINYITPNPAIEGENIIFSGSGTTSDSEEYITSYRWESDQYGFLSSYETFETTLPPGNYVITFRVRNNHGEWSKPDETHIEILPVVSENRPPTAYIDYISPTPPVYKGTNIAFEGHGEDPDNDEITEYEWRLDSQLLSKSGKFTTDNLQAGTHIVTFRVKDSNNEWSNPEEVFIEILQATSNNPPIAHISQPYPDTTVYYNTSILFEGYGKDPDGDNIITYQWSINNTLLNTTQSFTTGRLPIGTHTIQFRVQDSKETWSKEDKRILKVIPKPSVLPQIYAPKYPLVIVTSTSDNQIKDNRIKIIKLYDDLLLSTG